MEEEIHLKEKKELSNWKKMIIYFFIYALLGWILETVYCLITVGTFHKRGFLYGPICPIYGFGAILLLLSLKKVKGNYFTKFLIGMIVFSLFEFIVSYILEMVFNQRWWDYSNEFLNIEGRVSLLFSIAWGMIGVIFVEKIHPFFEKKLTKMMNRIPKKILTIVLSIFVIGRGVDTIFSIIRYIGI